MIANFGFGGLFIALLVSIYGTVAAIYGVRKNDHAWVESARTAMLLTFPLLTLSSLSLVYLLATGQFQVEYVALVSSTSMPSARFNPGGDALHALQIQKILGNDPT